MDRYIIIGKNGEAYKRSYTNDLTIPSDFVVESTEDYDSATPERKKMIICTLFKEINVGKGYEIEILMNGSYERFVA